MVMLRSSQMRGLGEILEACDGREGTELDCRRAECTGHEARSHAPHPLRSVNCRLCHPRDDKSLPRSVAAACPGHSQGSD